MRSLVLPLLLSTTQAAEPCLIVEEAANGWKSLTSPDYPKQFNPNTQCIYRFVKCLPLSFSVLAWVFSRVQITARANYIV